MTITTRVALWLSGIQIGLSLLFFGLGVEMENSLQTVTSIATTLLTIYLCYFCLREFRDKENNGFLSIWEGIKKGFAMTSKAGSILMVYFYVYYKFLNPSFIEKMKIMQEIELEKKGLSEKQMEQAMQITNVFTGPLSYAIMVFIGTIILGFVFSLIAAAILKKEGNVEDWK
jgi:choline-glycine betaine transporter